jgi:flagellar biosynthesis/type III secretory pathway M-ring protein FliF/YscJ
LPVTDAVLALASPGSSSSVSALWDKFKGAFSTIDDTTLIIVGVVGAVLVGTVVVLLLVWRQRQSY